MKDVNVSNFVRAESDVAIKRIYDLLGLNTWIHYRAPVPISDQKIIRMNRDTLYSVAIVNLRKPLTLTIPENNGRYFTVEVIDEDHYAYEVFTQPGVYTLTESEVGTQFAELAVRVFINPDDPGDVAAAHSLQDGYNLKGGAKEPFVLPNYDMERYQSLFKMVQQLVALAGKDTIGSMGKRGEVDSLKHTVATIAGWGLLPMAGEGFYYQWRMYEPGDEFLKGEYAFNLPEEVK